MHRDKLTIMISVLVTLIIADIMITYLGITYFGMVESNPLFYLFGIGGFVAIKMITLSGVGILWYIRADHPVEYCVAGLGMLYFSVLVNNLICLV